MRKATRFDQHEEVLKNCASFNKTTLWSKEVWKLNFRQYGQMEKHSQEESEAARNSDVEKVRREKIRDGESQKREDAVTRKGRKVVKHGVFPMVCGSGGSKSRLAKAAGAEPAGQMKDEKLHAVVARSTFQK